MNPEVWSLGCGGFNPSVSKPNKSTSKSLLFLRKILEITQKRVIRKSYFFQWAPKSSEKNSQIKEKIEVKHMVVKDVHKYIYLHCPNVAESSSLLVTQQ